MRCQMSRNGRSPSRPSVTTWIAPPCSTTKSRPLPSPAFAIASGASRPSTTDSSSIENDAGSNDACGEAGDSEAVVGAALPDPVGRIGVDDGAGGDALFVDAPHAPATSSVTRTAERSRGWERNISNMLRPPREHGSRLLGSTPMDAFEVTDLAARRSAAGRPYLEFLNV